MPKMPLQPLACIMPHLSLFLVSALLPLITLLLRQLLLVAMLPIRLLSDSVSNFLGRKVIPSLWPSLSAVLLIRPHRPLAINLLPKWLVSFSSLVFLLHLLSSLILANFDLVKSVGPSTQLDVLGPTDKVEDSDLLLGPQAVKVAPPAPNLDIDNLGHLWYIIDTG